MNFFTWIANKLRGTPAYPIAAEGIRPAGTMAIVGPKALALILEFEGMDQPWARPPGDSGITIGHGFDLGYCTAAYLQECWGRHLPEKDIALLRSVIGLKGEVAERQESRMRNVSKITVAMADEVFHRCTLPKWKKITWDTYPGMGVLNAEQQGVLVSLVFNRGQSLTGARRSEMLQIARILKDPNIGTKQRGPRIAAEIRSMKRLWPGISGLRRRRDAEAALMEAA